MKILSHRGYWKNTNEKNQKIAFERSFSLGFGTETDIRDCMGELVISHDMAAGEELTFYDFLTLASSYSATSPLTLALNIKSDGLSALVSKTLQNFPLIDCFVFDMSIPDMRSYLQTGVSTYTRMSEVESTPAWLTHVEGIWLDAFYEEWYNTSILKNLLDTGKKICIVSSELHGRNQQNLWKSIYPLSGESNLMLCTDHPEKANTFFN